MSDKNIKVITVNNYSLSESDGGSETEALDDFLGNGDEQTYNKQDVVEFFSDSEEAVAEEKTFWGGREESEDTKSESESESESVVSYGGKSASTVDELSRDPMFLVLSHFLTSKTGENIADILQGIKLNLAKLSFNSQPNKSN